MNYETIILELMGRVQILEQKMKEMEGQTEAFEKLIEENDFEEQDREMKITRSVARKHVMDNISRKYDYLNVQKGNRAKQADIIVTISSGDNKGEELFGKFYYSKSFHDFPSGWHTLKESDLEKEHIKFHIFTVSFENKFHNFIFSTEELKQYVLNKPKDSSDQYYFYFHIKEGGNKIVDDRDGEKDVHRYYENWNLFGEIIKNTK